MADAIKDILLKINLDTKSVDAGIKALDGKFESLGGNVKTDTFKTLKQQIREATNEAQNLGQQFGLNSQEFSTAAKKVAELKDQFGDANKVIEKFNPDNKLQGLVGIASGAATAIQGIAGAFTLIGVNADTAQVAIAKLQGVMALTGAISSIDDIKNSFSGLQGVAKNFLNSLSKGELIGIAIAGIAALGVAIYALTQNTSDLSEAQKIQLRTQEELNSINQQALKNSVEERVELRLLYQAASDTTKSVKERLSTITTMQDKFPGYFEDIKTEKDLNEKLAIAYNAATDGILAKARATAAFNKIVENENKKLELQSKLEEEKALLEQQKTAKFANSREAQVKYTQGEIDNLTKQIDAIDAVNEKISKTIPAATTPKKTPITTNTPTVEVKKPKEDPLARDVVRKTGNLPKLSDDEKTWAEISLKAEDALNQKMLEKKYAYNSELTKLDNERLSNVEALRNAEFLVEENNANARAELFQLELDNKVALMNGYASIATGLSQLAGDQTIAGKALAVAAASIDTYAAITKTLRAFGDKPIPGYAIAQAVATGIFGLVQVKKIIATKVPGKGGGSGAGSAPTPSASSIIPPSLNTTSLTQQVQDVRVTNQSGQSVVRAYITNEELRTNQDKQSFLNKLSSF